MDKKLLPKKSLGQHWLFDKQALDDVLNAGELTKNDTVLEIGPGLGTLTELLVKSSKKVIAVELDEELVIDLKKRFARQLLTENIEIIKQDILQFDLRTLPKNYKVVANIPYYLTSNLLRILLESTNPPKLLALLVQKEVAERITAKPGKMSILAISVQFYAKAQTNQLVTKNKFKPAPKVDSMILQIKPYQKSMFDVETKKFFKLVKAGFSQRRKTLKNALSAGLQISPTEVQVMLDQAKFGLSVRAQELSLNDWHKLYLIASRQKFI